MPLASLPEATHRQLMGILYSGLLKVRGRRSESLSGDPLGGFWARVPVTQWGRNRARSLLVGSGRRIAQFPAYGGRRKLLVGNQGCWRSINSRIVSRPSRVLSPMSPARLRSTSARKASASIWGRLNARSSKRTD